MKYFRTYPWGLQVFLFVMMIVITMGLATSALFTFLPRVTGYKLEQLEAITEQSPAALISLAVIVQGILSVSIFLIPALSFAYATTPRPAAYLGLRPPGKKIQMVLVIFIMLGAMPVLLKIGDLVSHINFGAKIKAEQAASDSTMNAFMNMPNLAAFIKGFIIMAIIPAFGEEMFFRGVLMRFAKKHSRTMLFPILFTAVVFAYSHTNIYGYLSIFLAGVLLAVIYNLTGSLWCSIIAHLVFNGTQLILTYMSNNNTTLRTFMENNIVPAYLVIGGAIVFGISFYLLLKNKTPLPANWTDDFEREESPMEP